MYLRRVETTKTRTDQGDVLLEAPVFLPDPSRKVLFERAVIEQFVAANKDREPIAETASIAWADANNGTIRMRARR